MELMACNFEFFPQESAVHDFLRPLLNGCVEIRFPYSIEERNGNSIYVRLRSQTESKPSCEPVNTAHFAKKRF